MTVTIEQAQQSLKELIEITAQGETVLITQDEKPIAELVPVSATKLKPVFGSCKGMLTVLAEDDEHLDDFTEYMK